MFLILCLLTNAGLTNPKLNSMQQTFFVILILILTVLTLVYKTVHYWRNFSKKIVLIVVLRARRNYALFYSQPVHCQRTAKHNKPDSCNWFHPAFCYVFFDVLSRMCY